jgi:DNA invertase Pin-like site-specific DNA recombinase
MGIIGTLKVKGFSMFYAYIRVSTEQQSDSGLGIEAQTSACVAYAKGELIAVFIDKAVSGTVSLQKRPQLMALLSELEKGDIVVVAKRDRIGRDPICVALIEAAIERVGASIVSCAGEGTEGTDPSHMLMRRMVDAFAEYERLLISTRTKAALQAKKVRGEAVGGRTPIGTKRDGKMLVTDSDEQAMIDVVMSMRAQDFSYQAIADHLNLSGYINRNGSAYSRQNIFQLCKKQSSV